jgi:ketosteroid isomerase-like protein
MGPATTFATSTIRGERRMLARMTPAIDRRRLLALAAVAVVPGVSLQHDDAAASIRTLMTRLRSLYQRRDVASLHTVVAADVVFTDPTFHFEAAGRDALQAMFTEHAANILDVRVEVERELILPPWAIVQQTQTFTMKTPAGPRTASARGVSLFRVERERMVGLLRRRRLPQTARRGGRIMTGPRPLAATVLVAFTAYTLWVVAAHGLGGFFGWVFYNSATTQVFFDLCISLTLAMLAVTADARARGKTSWPYWVLALLTGSIGALAYWVFRAPDARR